MNELVEILKPHSTNILLVAPPGWGKTYRLFNMIKASSFKWIFVSPLRALSDEVYVSALSQGIQTLSTHHSKKLIHSKINWKLLVGTVETLPPLDRRSGEYIYVFDEFHLFYYWGDSFRPKLLEYYQGVVSSGERSILLSATISETFQQRWEEEMRLNYLNSYFINVGNQRLKNLPHKTYLYPSSLKSWLVDDLLLTQGRGTVLVFCKYRKEVDYWVERYKCFGKSVIGCKGGEVEKFRLELTKNPRPQIIVATSTLSHGVNLPPIFKIYFLYKLNNLDFWIQMTGRGGRKGEKYECHTIDGSYFGVIDRIQGYLNVFRKRFSNKINSLI